MLYKILWEKYGISLAGTVSSSPEPPQHLASPGSQGASSLNGLRMSRPAGPCCPAISPGHKLEWVQRQAGNVWAHRDHEGPGVKWDVHATAGGTVGTQLTGVCSQGHKEATLWNVSEGMDQDFYVLFLLAAL